MRFLSYSRTAALAPVALALCLLGGCSTISNTLSNGITSVISPYRSDIVQGNVITREQMANIKPGTSRADVRDALGSPLIADAFHANRWDYVFTLRRPGVEQQRRAVVILFEGDKVASIDAPELPTELDFVASISRGAPSTNVRKLELTDEQRAELPAPKPVSAAAANQPQGAVRTYPPLEAP
ncbi:outer membrane protein assembly factor BamE [Ideonella margarita]|uniref:Outer membrane protein assembly factor BamE n=1 Tax=Ideonella margarita TaxID=2984191 RepID=A0ABU9C9N8_9BURK